ncbi:MAG TPA: YwmB family TATA-box binding protein [Tissierellaceae bacterium]|nr:YwmB family TATA-box binding protein [Tissierellaceae bacterium]
MRRVILFAIIILLLIPFFSRADKEYLEYEFLETILQDLEGEFIQGDVVINGVLIDEFIEKEEIEVLGSNILKKLKLVGRPVDPLIKGNEVTEKTYTKEVIFESDYNQIIYSGLDKEKNLISIFVSSYIYNEKKEGETYLCINIVKNDDFFEINDIIEDVKSIFKEYDATMEISSCIIGSIKGKVSESYMDKNLNKSLKRIKGRILEEYSDNKALSYTIYTPDIDQFVAVGNRRINLNIAIRYNKDEDSTYLWIGTPIITTGY